MVVPQKHQRTNMVGGQWPIAFLGFLTFLKKEVPHGTSIRVECAACAFRIHPLNTEAESNAGSGCNLDKTMSSKLLQGLSNPGGTALPS